MSRAKFKGYIAEDEQWLGWMRHIFGTPESYLASLPDRVWIRGESGWTSKPRG